MQELRSNAIRNFEARKNDIEEAVNFLRQCDDAGYRMLDAIMLLKLEKPDVYSSAKDQMIHGPSDLWRMMRVRKIDESEARHEYIKNVNVDTKECHEAWNSCW